MNTRKKLVVALSMALAFLSLLGCGTSNHLQTITLSSGSTSGTFNVQGIGGTLQLTATGNYSSGKTHNLTNKVTYTMVPDPSSGYLLPTPPLTAGINATGMITATQPAYCTWTNLNAADLTKPAAWVLDADYMVTATFEGVTSQPVFVGIGSAAGKSSDGSCGPK